MGLNPSKLEDLFRLVNWFFIMIQQTSLKTERRSFMPLCFSLAGLQNGLSLIFQVSAIKIQITFSIHGNYLNVNSSPYLGTQMKSEKLKPNCIPQVWKKVGMYLYTLLISEVWVQEFEIGVKGLLSINSGGGCHPGFWINWPPIFQELTLFKT